MHFVDFFPEIRQYVSLQIRSELVSNSHMPVHEIDIEWIENCAKKKIGILKVLNFQVNI